MTSPTKPIILGVLAVLALIASGCGDHPPQPIHAGPPGAYLALNGLEYQVQIARELNPADPSDAPYLRGIPAGQRHLERDQEWLGVFLLVQNPTNRPARAANELYMKDTSNHVFRPITLGRANDYAYHGSVVPGGGQIPVLDSPASQDQSVDGALVLFKIENTTRQDVPLELVIRDTHARAVGSLDLDT